MYLASFDVANKSLGVVLLEYINPERHLLKLKKILLVYHKKIKNAADAMDPDALISIYNDFNNHLSQIYKKIRDFKVCLIDVIDLLPDRKLKDVGAIERSYCLSVYLRDLKDKLKERTDLANIHYIIEYQMNVNDKTRTLASQLMFFCCSMFGDEIECKNKVILMGPSHKNKISFPRDKLSKHSTYISKYMSNYTANKAHTKYILQTYFKIMNIEHMLNHIKKKNMDDAADAFCMILSHIKTKCN